MSLEMYVYDIIAFCIGFAAGALTCLAAFAMIAGEAVDGVER